MNVIVTDGLTRSYGGRRGIESVDLAVPEGALFGFLGPNGAGKTTAIRVLLGLLRPTSGRARIRGLDCWRESRTIKLEVGYLPGDLRLYPWLTGEASLRMVGGIRGRDLLPAGRALAARFDLELDVKVRNMSRGTRQKLGIALALAHDPALLVLDEPSSGLDPLVQETLREVLRERTEAGRTVFFSSHSLSEVEQLCDRVAIIRAGRIVADSTLAALREQAGHEVTIRWPDPETAAAAEPPPFLAVERPDPRTWKAALVGSLPPLLHWLADRNVEDVAIGRPDLETLFRRYYEGEP
jgi:ABC-2 type transport system ATP-binding protein